MPNCDDGMPLARAPRRHKLKQNETEPVASQYLLSRFARLRGTRCEWAITVDFNLNIEVTTFQNGVFEWIVDGIAELDANNQEEAEKWVNEVLTQILNDNPIFSEKINIEIKSSFILLELRINIQKLLRFD